MRSRNTLILLVVLLALAVAAYFFMDRGDRRSTLDVEETAFAIKDTASVNRIFISSKKGANHTLERQPNGLWTLDKKYEARKDMVNLLLQTMHRIDIKRPVDKGARNSAIRDIATLGTKVEIYQNDELTKVFHVGTTTDNDLGTYFIMEGSETPYVMHIPGFDGFLNTRFDVSEFNWRSVPVFRNTAETIQELEIKYPTNPENNFKIVRAADKFEVSGLKDADQENVRAYLNNFRFVNGEFFFPNPMNRTSDSLAMKQPVAIVTITDAVPVNSKAVTLYPKLESVDHLVAVNEKNKDVMSVQNYQFDRLLIKKEAFRKKMTPNSK